MLGKVKMITLVTTGESSTAISISISSSRGTTTGALGGEITGATGAGAGAGALVSSFFTSPTLEYKVNRKLVKKYQSTYLRHLRHFLLFCEIDEAYLAWRQSSSLDCCKRELYNF